MDPHIRAARDTDETALAALDRRCWSVNADVAPRRADGAAFFGPTNSPVDILVAEHEGRLVGCAKLMPPTPLVSNAHVQQLRGLAVDPARRRAGAGRALLDAALDLARQRGARKVGLRVLGTNTPAQRLYRAAGFTVEGVLSGEFFLAGRYVDDMLMAWFG